MRIVSLQPYFTELLLSFGAGTKVCGVTHHCVVAPEAGRPAVVTAARGGRGGSSGDDQRLACGLSTDTLNLPALVELKPDLILAQCTEDEPASFVSWAEGVLERRCGKRVVVQHFNPDSVEKLYATFEGVAESIGNSRLGRELAQRTKAQIQDWTRNFYERARNKKVTVLASVEPLCLASGLIPDLVRVVTGQPQERADGKEGTPFGWDEVVDFRTDVIIVSPCGSTLQQSVETLKALEAIPEWESVPAVKRGEVIFCSGATLYSPGPEFIKSAAIVISALAGLDSGYITLKDEYFRLRFLELHRHRFV